MPKALKINTVIRRKFSVKFRLCLLLQKQITTKKIPLKYSNCIFSLRQINGAFEVIVERILTQINNNSQIIDLSVNNLKSSVGFLKKMMATTADHNKIPNLKSTKPVWKTRISLKA